MGGRLAKILVRVILPVILIICLFPGQSYANLPELKAYSTASIKVAVDKYLPPFSYLDETGVLTGYNIDLIRTIEKNSNLTITLLPMELDAAVKALKRDEIDAIFGMKYTSERDELFDFSDSVFTISETIVIPGYEDNIQHLADLKGHTTAVQRFHVANSLLKNVRRAQVNIAFNQREALELLINRRADAFVGNPWTAKFFLKQFGLADNYKLVGGTIQPADYAVAVHQGNYQLLDKLNTALKTIRATGQFDRIYYRWFGERLSFVTARLMKIIKLLALFIIITALLGLLWNRNLRIEVAKRTKELSRANLHLEQQRKLLAENDAFKEQVLASVKNGIITLDLDGRITTINPAAISILQLENKSPLYAIHFDKITPLKQILEPYREQVNAREEIQQAETEISFNNQIKNLTFDISPLYDVQNNIMGTLITLQDRTHERKLQQKLLTQEKMRALGQLIAGIAHELRNPLTSIKTFVELLPLKHHNPLFREEMARYLPREIARLNNIVEDLLDYSRPKKAEKIVFNAGRWMDSVLLLFKKTFRDKKVKVTTEIDEGLEIYADPRQLKQVAFNLILNALDAMENCGLKHLTISARKDGEKMALIFQDTGKGIPREQLDKIFDPFFTMKPNGVGLGLTITYQLIKENHGDILVTSKPNAGTTVKLEFPSARPELTLLAQGGGHGA